MSKALESLKILAAYRPSLIAASSFLSSTSNKADESDPNQTPGSDTAEFLETKYGLRIDIRDAESPKFKVSNTSPQSPRTQSSPRHHYRLFPDWQTSFFWRDTSKKEVNNAAATADDEDEDDEFESPEIDDQVIEARYPTLWPYYETWRQTYETAFEKQGCHLGSGAEVFPDVVERIAWDVEGLLMASWLALREDVAGVEYFPREKKFHLEKGGLEEELPGFLGSVWREGAFVEIK